MTAVRLSARDLARRLRVSAQLASQATLDTQIRIWTEGHHDTAECREQLTLEVAALNSIETYLSTAAMKLDNQGSLTSTRTKISGVTIISVWSVTAAMALGFTAGRDMDPLILATMLAATFGGGFLLAQLVLRFCYRMADRRTAAALATVTGEDPPEVVERLRSQIAATMDELRPEEDENHRGVAQTIVHVQAWLDFAVSSLTVRAQ